MIVTRCTLAICAADVQRDVDYLGRLTSYCLKGGS
jgi:hypothetical protein